MNQRCTRINLTKIDRRDQACQTENELSKLKAHKIERKYKEETYLAAIELVQNQAHCHLKTWMESDPI